MGSAELLLHPVRLRVVQALLGDRALTTAQLGELLPDVPAATLYRQVSVLVEGQVLQVVTERKVRGAVERTYRLVQAAAEVDVSELRRMTADQHRRGFLTFVAGLLAGFDRYLEAHADGDGRVDPVADRLTYRQTVMYLSDDELDEMLHQFGRLVAQFRDTPAGPGRSRRAISIVLLKE
ncbi:helix-turn-helix domain-containing protein [Arthrobacter zhaoguopingii]|uniref:helix-turn-helix domain-containing protein n=1 Tax=Arthrobacter zhaoguopingii TaxID=2681491 RepID=UPI001356A009|nr:helix-turn-helix domain-containing protein [Arthrobacter zhaoguopingii]